MRKSARQIDPTASGRADARALAAPIIDWLLDEQRLSASRITFLLDAFARRLRGAGVPIERARLHVQQLHPQLAGRSFVWDLDAGGATEMGFRHSTRDTETYTASPVRPIFEGGKAIRRRLEPPDASHGYPILEDLVARGFTDYLIVPLPFANRINNALSIATRRPGGFEAHELDLLDAVLPAFATLIELRQTRRTARDLLSTYVGPNAGERILSGSVKRGDGEIIHAVLWFCDLRHFTAMSQTEPLDQVIALLNTYFDRMAGPVTARGGEILKFVGDAMLAIFDCETGNESECRAVEAALAAAREALAGLATLNRERRDAGLTALDCGIAIHVGNVMYGNVGAADRLDFTVIGPAVNLVCRMEALCASFQCPILVSSELAHLAPERFVSRGRHALKGIADPQEIFAPIDRDLAGPA